MKSSIELIPAPIADSPLIFLKLGGSLITDKTQEATPRREILQRLAIEVRAALDARPEMRLLIGHGSGSFGHFAGRRYGTRDGVRTLEQWAGFAEVGAVAAQLNRLVTDTFLAAGVPVLSLQPSASAHCHDGRLESLALEPVQQALVRGLVPLLYGDVAFDAVRGGVIISAEEVFFYLAPRLRPHRILLVGEVAGVLDAAGDVIPAIRPGQRAAFKEQLGGSHGIDVTGGMFSKVNEMLDLLTRQPRLSVRICSGAPAGELERALLDPDYPAGTLLTA